MDDKGIKYPYTYAADYIRQIAGCNEFFNTKLSRSDASKIRQKIAKIIGIEDEELAKKLANIYIENQ